MYQCRTSTVPLALPGEPTEPWPAPFELRLPARRPSRVGVENAPTPCPTTALLLVPDELGCTRFRRLPWWWLAPRPSPAVLVLVVRNAAPSAADKPVPAAEADARGVPASGS